MGLTSSLTRVSFFMSLLVWAAYARGQNFKVFNVKKYGAVADGRTDSTKAFLKAWSAACHWDGTARVLIPRGVYRVDSMLFIGPCMGSMVFYLRGILKPLDKIDNYDQWITFRYVNWLTVSGGGTLDGEGYRVWESNDCHKNPNCRSLPASMRFEFVNNARVGRIRSFNSQNAHFSLFGCNYMNLTSIIISAPADSPNTDGIKIGSSTHIRVSRAKIGTGDDCIAVIAGSRSIHVSQIYCGPGHGISVGSMGKFPNEDVVYGLTVKNCTFVGTSDGVRIKTWASPNSGLASRFTYRDIEMINVGNPINIDQQYCPHPPCDFQIPSHIQIKDVTFNNIWGTTSSDIAVSLRCSRGFPCRNIVLKDINLSSRKGPARSLCYHVKGHSSGKQRPPSCL